MSTTVHDTTRHDTSGLSWAPRVPGVPSCLGQAVGARVAMVLYHNWSSSIPQRPSCCWSRALCGVSVGLGAVRRSLMRYVCFPPGPLVFPLPRSEVRDALPDCHRSLPLSGNSVALKLLCVLCHYPDGSMVGVWGDGGYSDLNNTRLQKVRLGHIPRKQGVWWACPRSSSHPSLRQPLVQQGTLSCRKTHRHSV